MAEKVTQQQAAPRQGREGGRWINERPTSEDFGTWFDTNMKIDPLLKAVDYIGGVVLIPAVDTKAKTVTGFAGAVPIIEEHEELSYIPYAKVETRINYFWDLLDAHESEWVAEVTQEDLPRLPITGQEITETVEEDGKIITKGTWSHPGRMAQMVYQLPSGFSVMSIPVGENYTHFICATTRVSIFRKGEDGQPIGPALRTGRGTKMVPFLAGRRDWTYADPSSLMKAETGALGRALGFAGIFVIPGSGVATAEDVQEAIAQGRPASEALNDAPEPVQPELPPIKTGQEQAEATEEELAARAQALWNEIKDDPAKSKVFLGWASQRKLGKLTDAKGAVLRGVVKKLETIKDQETPNVPAAESTEESG